MDIMVDIETLGQSNTAAVIAIGAVKFDPLHLPGFWRRRGSEYFSMMIDVDQAKVLGTVDQSSVDWWERQESEVRNLVMGGTNTPDAAFSGFSAFSQGCEHIWAKSPTFDCAILRYMCDQLNGLIMVEQPWKFSFPFHFRNERDVRTHCALGERLGINLEVDYHDAFPAHHPLGDAIRQATQVQLVNARIQQLASRSIWSYWFPSED